MCLRDANRRRFLQSLCIGAGAMSFMEMVPAVARAALTGPRRRFVFAYFEGGWDILLGLDPRDPATTNAAAHDIDPAYNQLAANFRARGVQNASGLSFGPAVPASFLAHAGDTSIINGIGMDTAAHEVGRRYFITGQFPRGLSAVGPSTAAEIVSQVGDITPIPHMSAGVEAYAPGLPTYASALSVNSISDISTAFTPFIEIDPDVLAAVEAYQDTEAGCAARQLDRDGLVSSMQDNRITAREFVSGGFANHFNIARTDAEMTEVRARYGLNGAVDPAGSEFLAFIAGQSLKNDICQAVSVRIASSLDTHSDWATDQPTRQESGWQALAALISDLKNAPLPEDSTQSLWEHTTLVAFSEFGRTPLMNRLGGRDHFLGNSALVAGAGIARGITVGKSAERGMMPVETDLKTGLGVDNPTQIQRDSGELVILSPKNVWATVLASAQLDYSYLRAQPIPSLLRP